MLEIACNKCDNCISDGCSKYGNDENIAVEMCASDGFKNYTGKKTSYCGIDMAIVSETPNISVAVGKDN